MLLAKCCLWVHYISKLYHLQFDCHLFSQPWIWICHWFVCAGYWLTLLWSLTPSFVLPLMLLFACSWPSASLILFLDLPTKEQVHWWLNFTCLTLLNKQPMQIHPQSLPLTWHILHSYSMFSTFLGEWETCNHVRWMYTETYFLPCDEKGVWQTTVISLVEIEIERHKDRQILILKKN